MVDPIDTSTLGPILHDPAREVVITQADYDRLAREYEADHWPRKAGLLRKGHHCPTDRQALRALARLRMEREGGRG